VVRLASDFRIYPHNSGTSPFHHANIYEALNRTFGNFKHIKLQNKDVTNGMKSDFNMAVERYTYANIINGKLSVLPRLALETTGFSLIVLTLVYILYKEQTNITHILPIVALFVLVLYRLLPSINRIFNAFNTIMYNYKSIEIINQELETNKDVIDDNLVSFNKKIELKDVGFRFGDFNVINQANMIINKYEKVAIIGASGSGKSTLVDIIIGLYKPVDGLVKIDDTILDDKNMQYWRSKVGYINQQVYLFDGTVSDNVVFGRKFDHNLLTDVLKKSNIYDFLMTKDGFDTMVGENGCQLSGGQKQRMVIARALYGDPEILILDEATSALDEKTEEKIMDEIYQIAKYKTMIIITHRLKAVKNCDSVYRIEKGRVYAT